MTLRQTVEKITGEYVSESKAMHWANNNFGILSTHIRQEFVQRLNGEKVEKVILGRTKREVNPKVKARAKRTLEMKYKKGSLEQREEQFK